ncbi:hypothetical protein NSTCB13_02269 [Nostoc sp. DSM 114160]|jgi:hypothetical protein
MPTTGYLYAAIVCLYERLITLNPGKKFLATETQVVFGDKMLKVYKN